MKRITMVTALLLATATAMAVEPTNQWYLRGPDGGYAYRVGIDPVSNRPLAGGITGIFRYNAGNFRWEFANAGAPTPVVADIATLPGATLVNSDGYVARSTDGGATWSNVSAAAMGGKVTALAASAASGTRVYATVNYGNNDPNGGLWISNNLGANWTQSAPTAGGQPALVRAAASDANLIFVASPAQPDTGGPDDGKSFLYRSADGGTSFSQVAVSGGTSFASGLPLAFVDVQQDPFNPARFVALTAPPPEAFTFKDAGGEVLVSTDGGLTWAVNINNFLVNGEVPGAEPRALLFDRFNTGVIYFATSFGVYKTSGGPAAVASNGMLLMGARASGGQPYDETSHLAQASDANHTLYAATVSGGVYRSIDSAANWSAITPGYNGLDVRMFAFQPGNTGVVLAGAADPSRINGVYRSVDGGVTWTRSATGMNPNGIRGIAFAPGNPNVVLASGPPQHFVGGETSKGVWRSTDAGQTWSKVTDSGIRNSGSKRNIQFDPLDSNRVLLSAGSALSLSTNGGVNWINSKDATSGTFGGLPMQSSNLATLLGLAAGPGPVSGTRFYAAFDDGNWPNPPPLGGAGGVYFSDDGGYHWTAGTGLPDDAANFISVSPTPGVLYASKAINGTTRAGGVFKSTNYGQTWAAATTGLPCLDIFAVAADPTDANIVWTACRYSDIAQPGGIFRSNDAAASWVPYGRGLRNPSILWLTVDPADHNHLLAGGLEGIHEMHFAPDADQDGIPDSEEASVVPGGDANNDGTPDAAQGNVASSAMPAGARTGHESAPSAADYVVVELDRTAPYTGTCQFVSDLQVVPTDQIAPSNRMLQAAPTVRFILPNCTQATVKIRYSATTTYPVGVFGSYSPLTPGDATTMAWGLFAPNKASVDGSGIWTVQLEQNSYGNVYGPNTGSILFQGAPGRDSIFASGFEL